MKYFWVTVGLLAGCSAPYKVPTDNLGRSIEPLKTQVTTIETPDLDAEKPGSRYVVRRGDTLFSIAWRFEQDPDVLKRRNQLTSDLILPGRALKLRGEVPPEPEPEPKTETTVRTPPVIRAESEPQPKHQVKEKPAPKIKKREESRLTPKAPPVPQLTGWQWPVNGPILKRYSSKTRSSRSLQLGGKAGTPVKAAASGRVVYAGDGLVGFGNLVIISHKGKFLSAYGHNQSLGVKVGDVVQRGQVIAAMGSTGTDRVKLHFEIRKQGRPIDPVSLMPKRKS
jgi:lipoprotein NlpD